MFISEDLMALLTCGLCQKFCGNNIIQCRKGHVICKPCKSEGKITSCKFTHPDGRICKQTFVDAPNVVLDKLIRDVVITLLLSYLCTMAWSLQKMIFSYQFFKQKWYLKVSKIYIYNEMKVVFPVKYSKHEKIIIQKLFSL